MSAAADRILHRTVTLPLARERVFPFFADAANLEAITPPALRFRIVTPLPIAMRLGTRIEYRLRIRGWPVAWISEITHWDPPRAFEDTQVRGPYAIWVHRHTFEETASPAGAPATSMTDEVRYRLPFGRAGGLAHPLVRAELERIFSWREEAIGRLILE